MEFVISIALALVVVLWVAFSPDPLARVIRVRFQGAKAQATSALDDAIARVESAEAGIEDKITKANEALLEVKTSRKGIQTQYNTAIAEVTKYTNAAENAASVGRKDLVVGALERKQTAEQSAAAIKPQLDFLTTKEQEVESARNTLQRQKAQIAQQKVQIRTRASTAKTTIGVNELLAGIDLRGNTDDLQRANQIVSEMEARSGALAEMASQVNAEQQLDQELDALSHPQTNVQDEADALMAKYSQPQTT